MRLHPRTLSSVWRGAHLSSIVAVAWRGCTTQGASTQARTTNITQTSSTAFSVAPSSSFSATETASTPANTSFFSTGKLNASDVPLNTPAEVEEAFACSVAARTVSNVQLRRYLERLTPKDYALGLAAVKGAKSAGLRINAHSYEALLKCLMEGGQLRASMELYQQMMRQNMTPTQNMYAALMELCLQRDMPRQCQTLFNDLQRRGLQPSTRNYELMITSLSTEVPPQWERAIEVFDKIAGERHSRVTAQTYNALMRVYMNMDPFDWRVVYNCYTEMRERRPRIRLEWESYLILREALRKGRAGYVRRAVAYFDAWVAVTPLRSWNFFLGAIVYFGIMMVMKSLLSYAMVRFYRSNAASAADSVLPV
jgi:pentatricopeptide repeat protein